jgi:hypothetical protein
MPNPITPTSNINFKTLNLKQKKTVITENTFDAAYAEHGEPQFITFFDIPKES